MRALCMSYAAIRLEWLSHVKRTRQIGKAQQLVDEYMAVLSPTVTCQLATIASDCQSALAT